MKAPKKIIMAMKRELLHKETSSEETSPPQKTVTTKPATIICAIPNGNGKKNLKKNQYSKCYVTSCDSGFTKWKNHCRPVCAEDEAFYNGTCNPVIAQCSVNGGDGEKVWDGDHYGSCISSENFRISSTHSLVE